VSQRGLRQMKTLPIERVRSLKTLGKAWSAVRKNARLSKTEETRNEAARFEADAIEHIGRIQRQLQSNSFKFLPALGKKIPKKNKTSFRPLVIAPLESRIVQRAVHDVLVAIPPIQKYVKTPHSFGGVRKNADEKLAAVPAAIEAVLMAIGNGYVYVVRSDISDFFTKIPKSKVTELICEVVHDDAFIKLFSEAIQVELANLSHLRSSALAFPIEDIGVAQGNSLSPLLGNMYLYDFDHQLNSDSNVRCLRYIDDFIILASSRSAANEAFDKARKILASLGLSASDAKTFRGNANDGFEFLGIEIITGFLRPSADSRKRLMNNVESILSESEAGFNSLVATKTLETRLGFINTLKRVSSAMHGWGKHYWFCNDNKCLSHLDKDISRLLRQYFACYSKTRNRLSETEAWTQLGVEALGAMDRSLQFRWPPSAAKHDKLPGKASHSVGAITTLASKDDAGANDGNE